MALNVNTTVTDITTALDAIDRDSGTEAQRWTAVVNALYTRIKADLQIVAVVKSGISVTTTGGNGTTNGTGEADAGSGTGSIT